MNDIKFGKQGIKMVLLAIFFGVNSIIDAYTQQANDLVKNKNLVVEWSSNVSGHVSAAEKDLFEKALSHAEQANKAFNSALRNTNAWLAIADSSTLLLPDHMDKSLYTPHNSAADNYPFMVLSSYCTDRDFYNKRAKEMLFNELRFATLPNGLCCGYDFQTRKKSEEDVLFGASEYIKDGLIPMTELMGPSIWSERMTNLTDIIINNSKVKSNYGLLPSTDVEVNGEILQSVSRLYTMTGNIRYLELIERIGDAYCFEVIPNYYGLPARNWDFTENIPQGKDPYSFGLSDHGNEIISGLVQLYITMKHYKPEKAKKYYQPIKGMLDRIVKYGIQENGFFYYFFDVRTGKPVGENSHSYRGKKYSGIRTAHAWGYIYLAYLTFYQATGEEKYKELIVKMLESLNPEDSFWWTQRATAISDVVEGVLYLVNRIPNSNGFKYLEVMTDKMLSQQKKGGEFERWYGDGNVSRTALMYALYKTQGLQLQPWKPNLEYGAIYENGTLYISIHSEQNWEGKLFFDYPRSRDILHLPINYGRINEYPEWYTVESFDFYDVYNSKEGRTKKYPGIEMVNGVDLSLNAGDTVFMKVE